MTHNKMVGLNKKGRAGKARLKGQVRETSTGQFIEGDDDDTWVDAGEDEDDIDLDEQGIDATQDEMENEQESNFDGDDEHDDDKIQ